MSVGNISSAAATAAEITASYTQTEGAAVQKPDEQVTMAVIKKQANEVLNMQTNIVVDKTLEGFITDALKAAGLPQNDRMMQLVQALLDRQQPIDKNTLIAYNRLLGQNPGVNVDTLIAMQKNGFNITKENITQFENYQNNENQLFRNIDNVTDSLGNMVKNIFNEDNAKAVDLLNGLAKFVNDMGGQTTADVALKQQTTVEADSSLANHYDKNATEAATDTMTSDITGTLRNESANIANLILKNINMAKESQEFIIHTEDKQERVAFSTLVEKFESQLPVEAKIHLSAKSNLFKKLAVMLDTLPDEKSAELASKLDTKEFVGLAKEAFKEALFLEPEVAADKEKLTAYYKKLEQSVNEFLNTAKELGDSVNNSALARTFNNVADNVTFMNQINEYMPYIQLPLKLLKEEAHGEFYVMKRRKQQAQQGDTLTAFLRLNMTNLGELDIMVKLKEQALDVDFKAEKADVVDFIANNLMTLEGRLREKGYIPSMRASEKEKEFDFEKDFLEAESNEGTIGRYSFDMKI